MRPEELEGADLDVGRGVVEEVEEVVAEVAAQLYPVMTVSQLGQALRISSKKP